jgi:hypothetical protein
MDLILVKITAIPNGSDEIDSSVLWSQRTDSASWKERFQLH